MGYKIEYKALDKSTLKKTLLDECLKFYNDYYIFLEVTQHQDITGEFISEYGIKFHHSDSDYRKYTVTIDLDDKIISKVNSASGSTRPFQDAELEFFDRLGCTIDRNDAEDTGQEIEDWWGK